MKEFNHEKNSRIGNLLERAAYLGAIIIVLVDENHYSIEAAWKAVCDDSCELGHYMDSNNVKYDIESTGNRKVGPFFDLANVNKIIRDIRNKCHLLVGGSNNDNGWQYPLVEASYICDSSESCYDSVGWLVFDVLDTKNSINSDEICEC